MGPRRLSGVVVRPLNFTVRGRTENPHGGGSGFEDPRPRPFARRFRLCARGQVGKPPAALAPVASPVAAVAVLCVAGFVASRSSGLRRRFRARKVVSMRASSNQRWNGP